ncbi:MAG TPA: carboxypeptidase regulatory-like domain-containing protein [Kofleriaceae bacterium]|nr:carboxypeptidase regulatory-like domain-containing protein [Kofleriaceae bacterium]
MRALAAAAVIATLLLAARSAAAGPTGVVEGKVAVERARGGTASRDVVVYLVGFDEPPPARTEKIVQKKRRFQPDLLAITAGQSVAFPNADPHFHNVFSPSPVRPFDLGSFEAGESKERRFPRPAAVDVYCNIHPEMSATILVLPNRRFAIADRAGRFRIEGVPPGTWSVYAYSRRVESPVTARVTVAAGRSSTVELSLRETRTEQRHRNKYGETYRSGGRYDD